LSAALRRSALNVFLEAANPAVEEAPMISALLGGGLFAGSAFCFWRLLPVNGAPHRLVVSPYLDTLIPVSLMAGSVLGLGLLLAGVSGSSPF
jgi:hypothetical protein